MTSLSRQAPPVHYPLRRSAVLGAILAFWLLAGAAVMAAWALLGARSWPLPLLAAGLWLLALCSAWHFWRGQFQGAIRWDGRSWALEDLRPPGFSWPLAKAPEALVDLQTHLWLCASPQGRACIWLWIERSARPERWTDLRRALYSRARPDADSAGEAASQRGA